MRLYIGSVKMVDSLGVSVLGGEGWSGRGFFFFFFCSLIGHLIKVHRWEDIFRCLRIGFGFGFLLLCLRSSYVLILGLQVVGFLGLPDGKKLISTLVSQVRLMALIYERHQRGVRNTRPAKMLRSRVLLPHLGHVFIMSEFA